MQKLSGDDGVPAELIFFLKLRFFGTRKPSAGIEPPSYSQSRRTSSNYFSHSIKSINLN